MKKHPSPLRRAVGLVLTLLLTLGYFSPTQQALRALPASLRLTQDEPISLLTGMLRASGEGLEVSASQDETLSQYVSVTGQKSGTSELLLSILGIPLRRVEVEVSPEKRLIPGGQALGVAMRTDGVLIVGLSDVKKGVCPARDCGLQPGDVLLRIGGHAIERVADVSEIAQQNGTSPLLIEYMRDGTTAHATLTPVQDDATGVVRLGAWVRDSTAGIGTLSFYDPDSGQYAALGHAITDGDTGSILTVREGRVLNASIVAVQKGQRGVPGELKGSFLQNAAVLGDIAQNTTLGISGTLTVLIEVSDLSNFTFPAEAVTALMEGRAIASCNKICSSAVTNPFSAHGISSLRRNCTFTKYSESFFNLSKGIGIDTCALARAGIIPELTKPNRISFPSS